MLLLVMVVMVQPYNHRYNRIHAPWSFHAKLLHPCDDGDDCIHPFNQATNQSPMTQSVLSTIANTRCKSDANLLEPSS